MPLLQLLTRNRVGASRKSILVSFPDPRSLLLADSKVAELQQQLLATSTDLLSEKAQHEALKRLHLQQSQQQQETITRLEQENDTLQQQQLIRNEETEVRMQLLQSQAQDKEAVIVHLQVSSNEPPFSLFDSWAVSSSGIVELHEATRRASATEDGGSSATAFARQRST